MLQESECPGHEELHRKDKNVLLLHSMKSFQLYIRPQNNHLIFLYQHLEQEHDQQGIQKQVSASEGSSR